MGQERQRGEIQRLTEHFYIDEHGHLQFSFPIPMPKKGHTAPEKDSEAEGIMREVEELPEPFRSQAKEDWTRRLAGAYATLLEIAQRHKVGAPEDASETEEGGGREQEI